LASDAIPLAEGVGAWWVVDQLVSNRQGVSDRVKSGVVVVVLHLVLVGCQEVSKSIADCWCDAVAGYTKKDACLL